MGSKKVQQLVLVSIVVFILSAWLASLSYDAFKYGRLLAVVIAGLGSLFLFIFGLMLCDMMRLNPSDSHGWSSLITQYLAEGPVMYYAGYRLKKIPAVGEAKKEVQTKFLMNLMRKNENTLYGKDHGFKNIHSVEDYIKNHPLTNYAHFEKYISRVVDDGEVENVLTKEKPVHIAITSGTTGKNKQFPIYRSYMSINDVVTFMHYRIMSSKCALRRQQVLYYKPSVKFSKTGIPIAPLTYYSVFSRIMPFFLSPREAYHITNESDALYVHAVYALAEEDLAMIEGFMSGLVYSFFEIIEKRHSQICTDIKTGTLSNHLSLSASVKEVLNMSLEPNPTRAEFLQKEFAKGFQNVTSRVWPNIRSVNMSSTGGFRTLADVIKSKYLGPEVKIVDAFHGASEGPVGIKLFTNTTNDDFVLLPSVIFYEFIKECDIHLENPKTYLLHEIEIGESYEVVITNGGLYRYRLGDVIKITGYTSNCPTYQFAYRVGQMLNLNWEKTPESVFYEALKETVSLLPDVQLIDYTAIENSVYESVEEKIQGLSKYYVLFLELRKGDSDFILTEKQKEKFDEILCKNFELYGSMREKGAIDPMQVIQIKQDGFMRLRLHMNKDKGNIQFKMPRVLRNKEFISLLLLEKLTDPVAFSRQPQPCVDHVEEFVHLDPPDKGYSLLLDAKDLMPGK